MRKLVAESHHATNRSGNIAQEETNMGANKTYKYETTTGMEQKSAPNVK